MMSAADLGRGLCFPSCPGFVGTLNGVGRGSRRTCVEYRRSHAHGVVLRMTLEQPSGEGDGEVKPKRRGRPRKKPLADDETEATSDKARGRRKTDSDEEGKPSANTTTCTSESTDKSVENGEDYEDDVVAGDDLAKLIFDELNIEGRPRSKEEQEEDDRKFDEFLRRGGEPEELWAEIEEGDDADGTAGPSVLNGAAVQSRLKLDPDEEGEDDLLASSSKGATSVLGDEDDVDPDDLDDVDDDEDLSLFTDLGIEDLDGESSDGPQNEDEEDMSYIDSYFENRRDADAVASGRGDDEDDDSEGTGEDDDEDDDDDDDFDEYDDILVEDTAQVDDDIGETYTFPSVPAEEEDVYDDDEGDIVEVSEAEATTKAAKKTSKKSALGADAELLALLSNASGTKVSKSSAEKLKTKEKAVETSAQLEEAEDDFDEEDLFDEEEEEVKTLEDYDEDDRDEIDQYIGEMATQRGVTAKVLDVNEDEYITVTEGPDKDFIWGDDLAEEDKVAYDAGLDEAPRIGIFGGTAKEAARRGEIVEGSSDWFARQLFERSLSVQDTNSLAWLKWVKGVGAPPPEIEEIMATRFPKPKLGTIIATPTPMVSLSADEDEAEETEDEDEDDMESEDSEILDVEETDEDGEDLDDVAGVAQDFGADVDLDEINVADENS